MMLALLMRLLRRAKWPAADKNEPLTAAQIRTMFGSDHE